MDNLYKGSQRGNLEQCFKIREWVVRCEKHAEKALEVAHAVRPEPVPFSSADSAQHMVLGEEVKQHAVFTLSNNLGDGVLHSEIKEL